MTTDAHALCPRPDAANHNPDPRYLHELLERAGLNQREAAELIGISDRAMRKYLSEVAVKSHTDAPYTVQFALEYLAWLAQLPPFKTP